MSMPSHIGSPTMTEEFDKLSDFINKQMRMSHVYQPVMLIELLKNQGSCSTIQIAKALLGYDTSQIEYYEHITKTMVGKVLTDKRGITSKEKDVYLLKGFNGLTPKQIVELISLCERKIEEFIAQRGERIWQHRKKSAGYISGTIRYEILKRAKFRCELCGISADKKAIEVDHIVPRNSGGSDDKLNLQALCYSCNAMKRDRDDTDFRGIRYSYSHRQHGCIFCEIASDRIISENELAIAIRDAFPVTELHTLIIPKRHISSYFELFQPELNAIQELLQCEKNRILKDDNSVSGFNIGNNSGADAGQTILHCHVHLIPRRFGDVVNPQGGVRGVITDKQKY